MVSLHVWSSTQLKLEYEAVCSSETELEVIESLLNLTLHHIALSSLHSTQVIIRYAAWDSDKTQNLLLFLPLCSSLSSTEHFFFSWLQVFDGKEEEKKATIDFCVELLHRTAASFVCCGDIVSSLSCSCQIYTDTFERKSFSCLVWKLLFNLNYIAAATKDQMFSAEINFPTGTLIKEFRCTFLSSVVNGSAWKFTLN